MRLALLAFLTFPGWACATAINGAPSDSSPLAASGSGGSDSAGNGASAGSSQNVSTGGAAAGSGASGAPAAGAPGSGGKGGSGSGGAGTAGSVGKAGSSSAGAPSAGASNGGASAGGAAGTSSGGTSAGGASAGTGSAGAGEAGGGGGVICDAAHATVTFNQQDNKTVQANDCVHLVVNPGWATVQIKLQAQPGTATYPVPFTFFNCGGNGTGSLTADYAEAVLKSGPNPGCDFFVQFGGGATAVKVTYFD